MINVSTISYRPMVAVWVALYGLASVRDWRSTSIAVLATLIPASLSIVDEIGQTPSGQVGQAVALYLVVFSLVNVAVTLSGRSAALSMERFADLLSRQRQGQQQAVQSERARIGRELHDIVAHTVSLMVIQSAATARMVRSDPTEAERSLTQVSDLGHSAIAELHRLLGLMQSDGTAVVDADPVGCSFIEKIESDIPDFARAGMPIVFHVIGDPCAIDASINHAAYRVLQESLTNALKHGSRASATCASVEWQANDLMLVVSNKPGSRKRMSGAGRGILGMRERVRAMGGDLFTGFDSGEFRVVARLPIGRSVVGWPEAHSNVYRRAGI